MRFCLQMITAVQRKALSDEDVRTNQQFAKLFEDTIKVCLLVGIEFFALHPQVLSRSHSNRPNMLHDSGLHVYWRTRSYKTRKSIPLNTAPTLLFLMESRSMYFTFVVCLFVRWVKSETPNPSALNELCVYQNKICPLPCLQSL